MASQYGNEAAAQMQQTMERFFAFIEKLEIKLAAFTDTAIPELTAFANENPGDDSMALHRMKSAVLGQIDGIRQKAEQTKEEKITCYLYPSHDPAIKSAYFNLRNACYQRVRQLEDLCTKCRNQVEDACIEDYEAEYSKILEEYESIKNKFTCVQCGSPVSIDKLYFVTTYITCPACQTRNNFNPGSKAKTLEHLGRSLAEQRTKHLLEEHAAASQQAQLLFQQVHRLKLDIHFEKNKEALKEQTARLAQMEQQKLQKINDRDALYQKYLRSMFDEWNKINPALSTQHEEFYKSLLEEYYKRNKNEE